MTVLVRQPSPLLRPFVSWLGYYPEPFPAVREVLVPSGAMVLVVNLDRSQAYWYDGDGLTTAHAIRGGVVVSAGAGRLGVDLVDLGTVAGVMFRPGGAYPFFQAPASAFDRPIVELDTIWGRAGGLVRDRLLALPTPAAVLSTLEQILIEQLARPPRRDPGIAWAVAALDRGMAVAAVADRLGVTDRTLLRRFAAQVGLTPKAFGRIRRLHRVMAWVPDQGDVDWARAAVECGYFDQAHLINEFRALIGITPTAYRPRSASCRNHEAVTRLTDFSNASRAAAHIIA